MKIGVLNFSGNVGKSTITKFLLLPRFPEAVHITIESINSNTANTESTLQLKGRDVDTIQEQLLINDDVIVDIGASNVEQFINGMNLFAGSIEDFDLFIVPVTPEKKQQVDTITTVDTLLEMGVSKDKIKVIFNRIQVDMQVKDEFYALINYLESIDIKVTTDSYIPDTMLFERANDSNDTVESILADKTDYKALIKSSDSKDDKLAYAAKVMLPRIALGVKTSLDGVASSVL
jgi:hypothetical protein